MQKNRTIVRKIEGLGRLVIPKAVREHLGLEERGDVEFRLLENGQVMLSKYKCKCVFCGKEGNLSQFKDELICSNCINEMKEL